MNTQSLKAKPAKSVELTPKEKTALKKYVNKFSTEVDAAISIGIDRTVLNRVMAFGSTSVVTAGKIRAVLAANLTQK